MKKKLLITAVIFFAAGFLFAQESIEPEKIYEIENHNTVLEIAANLPDVNVFLNETFQGRTNLTIYDLTPGFYQLRLEKQGCEPQEHTVFVKAHYGQRYFIQMR